jgi:signal transduction histidine kinase
VQEEARASRAQLAVEVSALNRVHDLIASLVASASLADALEKLLRAAIDISSADMGNIQFYDPENRTLEIVAHLGFQADFIDHFRIVRASVGSACSRTIERRARVIIEDVELDPEYAPHRAIAASAGYRAVQSTPILGREGEVLGVLSTHFREPKCPGQRELAMLDLYTQLAISFIERLRAEEALKAADRRKNEFLATLAHELRNPLAPIRNALQIITLAAGEPAQIAEARDILDRQSRQMGRIVDDLLDMSRIVQGKIELQKQRVPLAVIVDTAVESSSAFIEARRQKLTVSLPPEPLDLDADPVRMAQVLVNLLNNAAKFTDHEGAIDLTARTDLARSEVVISVRDTGDGIPAELLPRVFDMFTQGDRSLARSQGGLGVGLTLVRSLVDVHGGRVEAKSDGAGKGSEFIVRLPLATPEPHPEPEAPRRPPLLPTTKGRRILVVDDNVDNTETLARLLKLQGHEVERAFDGPSALEKAVAFVPDLALVDIGLPGMNGYEVAARFRAQPALKNLVLVAQTGWGEDARDRASAAGFNHFETKPVDIAKIQRFLAAPDREE